MAMAVSSNAGMHCCFFRVMLIMSMAFMPFGHSNEEHTPLDGSATSDSQKAGSMMRRETPLPKEKPPIMLRKQAPTPERTHTMTINAEGELEDKSGAGNNNDEAHQQPTQKPKKVQKELPWHSAVLNERDAQQEVFSERPSPEEPAPVAAVAKMEADRVISDQEGYSENDEKHRSMRTVIGGDDSAFVEDASSGKAEAGFKLVSAIQTGLNEKKHNVAKLSDEDEELYYKFFPEDKPLSMEEVSALQVEQKKSFKIKVPVSNGKKLCLTEANFGGKVSAEPCRKKSTRQKWYWLGSKLKNLHSSGHCLGLGHPLKIQEKSETSSESATVLETSSNSKMLQQYISNLEEVWKHTVSMEFLCSDKDKLLKWELDKSGRLKSSSNSQCLAINEKENFNAFVLPCEAEVKQ
jgi:hypothetical protein